MKIESDDGIVVDRVDIKRMSDDGPVLRKGLFKGKRVEFASTARIQTFEDIAEEFMLSIFGFEPGHYLITTVKFYQEVYGSDGKLREVHHKYPVDLGHQQVTGDEP